MTLHLDPLNTQHVCTHKANAGGNRNGWKMQAKAWKTLTVKICPVALSQNGFEAHSAHQDTLGMHSIHTVSRRGETSPGTAKKMLKLPAANVNE